MRFSIYDALLNVLHVFFVFCPLVVLLFEMGFGFLFLLSIANIFIGVFLSFCIARRTKKGGFLLLTINEGKDNGLKKMQEVCFAPLWFVPKLSLLPVSNAAWSNSIKEHGNVVYAAIVASKDGRYLALSALCFLGIYAAYSGEFGIVFSQLSGYMDKHFMQKSMIIICSWVSSVFFINFMFRFFVVRGER